eukprot:6744638-Alexandrium_andersonii.AAC.1
MNERVAAKKKARELDWCIQHPDHWTSKQRDLDADRRCYEWYCADYDWYSKYAGVAQSAIDIVKERATAD